MANEKILIVDDDPDIAKALRAVLKSQNYTVLCAGGEVEGMEMVEAHRPDLIILDVMMSTTSEGFDMSRKLRKHSKHKDIPILMLTAIKQKTGFDFKSSAGDPEWLPVDEFLDKPIDPELLLEKVKALLEKDEEDDHKPSK
jgi:DNA-binding response OmpR family regulator